MVIDQNACIGCNACVVACQAENNIPVVGKEQVTPAAARCTGCGSTLIIAGRHRRSPRDRIFSRFPACSAKMRRANWSARSGRRSTDAEGINNMVYNRCVGTRYCSNNCPYKVRHFNFLQYSDTDAEPETGGESERHGAQPRRDGEMHLLHPAHQRSAHRSEETVRRPEIRDDEDAIYDGEVLTACQQSCPTQAIISAI